MDANNSERTEEKWLEEMKYRNLLDHRSDKEKQNWTEYDQTIFQLYQEAEAEYATNIKNGLTNIDIYRLAALYHNEDIENDSFADFCNRTEDYMKECRQLFDIEQQDTYTIVTAMLFVMFSMLKERVVDFIYITADNEKKIKDLIHLMDKNKWYGLGCSNFTVEDKTLIISMFKSFASANPPEYYGIETKEELVETEDQTEHCITGYFIKNRRKFNLKKQQYKHILLVKASGALEAFIDSLRWKVMFGQEIEVIKETIKAAFYENPDRLWADIESFIDQMRLKANDLIMKGHSEIREAELREHLKKEISDYLDVKIAESIESKNDQIHKLTSVVDQLNFPQYSGGNK